MVTCVVMNKDGCLKVKKITKKGLQTPDFALDFSVWGDNLGFKHGRNPGVTPLWPLTALNGLKAALGPDPRLSGSEAEIAEDRS